MRVRKTPHDASDARDDQTFCNSLNSDAKRSRIQWSIEVVLMGRYGETCSRIPYDRVVFDFGLGKVVKKIRHGTPDFGCRENRIFEIFIVDGVCEFLLRQ